MTDSQAYPKEAFWHAMDLLRGVAPHENARVFFLGLLLHRLQNQPRNDTDEQSLWRQISHDPVGWINRAIDAIERELHLRIERPRLDPGTARHLLHLVNDATRPSQADLGRSLQYDGLLEGMSAHTGEFYTPKSVVAAMVDMLDPQPNRSIFDPAAGSGGLLSGALEYLEKNGHRDPLQVYGVEKNTQATTVARMNLALHGHPSEGLTTTDAFNLSKRDSPGQFDYVISDPPVYREFSKDRLEQLSAQPEFAFGPALPASDLNFIQLAVSRLKSDGTACLLVRFARLFSGGKERDIRERLVRAGCVECVVSLSTRLLRTTSAPCAILLLKAPRPQAGSPRVKFVAADTEFAVDKGGKRYLTPANMERISAAVRSPDPIEGFSTIKTVEELAQHDFSLVPSTYLDAETQWINLGPNTVMRRLGDVATIRRGSTLGGLSEGDIPILQGRDLPQRKIYREELECKALPEGEHPALTTEEADIVIQRIGASPSTYYIDGSMVDIAVSDTVYVVRLHKPDENTARFIAQFLRSSEGRARLRAALPPGTIPTLSQRSLQDVHVPFADAEVMKLALDLEDLENAMHEHVELAGELKSKLFDARSPDQFAATIRDLKLRHRVLKDSLQHSGNLSALNATVGVATLEEAIAYWEQHQNSGDEPFWHRAIEERPFLLAQLFHYPVVIVGSKMYVGGKRLDNHHGSVADFLAKNRKTGAALIIEIKKPGTELLGGVYRDDVFPWHREISGAVSQVLHYHTALSREVVQLRNGVDEHLESDALRCLVIAGNVGKELDTPAKRRSFEQLRESLHGVSIIGFDELFERAKEILEILTSPR
jgi:type I restriction-modification system DNA methylase subunit